MRVSSLARAVVLLLSAVVVVPCFGVRVDLPHKGKFQVWFDDEKGRQLGTKLDVSGQSRAEVVVPEGRPKTLVVRDVERNNLAVFPFDGDAVVAKPEHFKYAAEVQVSVEHRGKAVASAVVKLRDLAGERQELLSPDMKGLVSFYRVRFGEVSATVEYRVKGVEKSTGRLSIELTADRAEAVPLLAFSIPDEVVVVNGNDAALVEERRGPRPRPAYDGLSAGAVITILIALAGGLGAIYLLVRYVRNREDRVKALMAKLGVQPPGDGTDAQAAGAPHSSGFRQEPPAKPTLVPEGACPFCGQTKAVDGSCGCVVGAAAAQVPPSTGVPRLVVLAGPCAGRSFELTGEAVVGRDVACDLALVEDASVSRRHARLSLGEGVLRVEDLGSTNGTFVNGVRAEGPQELRAGDILQFGESRLRYEG